jgi:hypothetical protein
VMLNSHPSYPRPDIDKRMQGRYAKLLRRRVGPVVRSGGFWRYPLRSGRILGQFLNCDSG